MRNLLFGTTFLRITQINKTCYFIVTTVVHSRRLCFLVNKVRWCLADGLYCGALGI